MRYLLAISPSEPLLSFSQGVADQLRHLYEHPDFVELYPGLVAEEAKKPMVPGVGIAPTFTISRAVLSDAVALVRGDRFYTVSSPTSTGNHPPKISRLTITPKT